jgi:hypothetical protein
MRIPDLSRLVRRKRGPAVTREEALSAQPVRHPAITWEVQDSGLVLLTVPLAVKPWVRLIKFLVSVPDTRPVELDEVGSDVWQWCDGQRTVRELIAQLAAAHRLDAREAEVSLTQFLQTLARRRFVGLKLELDPGRQEALAAAAANTDGGGRKAGRRRR